MVDLWEPLDDNQRQTFVDNLQIASFAKDNFVYRAQEEPTHLLYLTQGKVKICKDGIGGRQQIVRLIKPGTVFGYRSAFAGESHRTTAITNEPSTIAMLPIHIVKSLIRQNSQFAIVFLKQLSYALGLADNHTINLTQKHLRGRLADALIRLISNFGFADDGRTINVSMSREDLANLSNMTTSNAIRTLSSFAAEGLIAIEGKKILVLNRDQLSRTSSLG